MFFFFENIVIFDGFQMDKFGRCGRPAPGCDGVGKQLDECVVELIRFKATNN